MKVKVFQLNNHGKIEFTREELEKLLNEVYSDGYKEGEADARAYTWTWNSPFLTTATNAINYRGGEATTTLDNSNAAKTYTVKATGSISSDNLSCAINDIACHYAHKTEDAFDKLAKELNY